MEQNSDKLADALIEQQRNNPYHGFAMGSYQAFIRSISKLAPVERVAFSRLIAPDILGK